MSRRRVVLATVGLVVLAAAAVGLGRWERGHQARVQSDGMARVLAAIDGRLVQPALSVTYAAGPLVCLLYDTRERNYGVSVCFDDSGRLAEAVDVRSGTPSWWSLRFEPSLGRYRVNPAEVRGALLFLTGRKVHMVVKAAADSSLDACTVRVAKVAYALREPRKVEGSARQWLTQVKLHCRQSAKNLDELPTALRARYPELASVVQRYVTTCADAAKAAGVILRGMPPGSTTLPYDRLGAANRAAKATAAAAAVLEREMAQLKAAYALGRIG